MVAKTHPLAQRAAKLVKIEYKDLSAIITIEVSKSYVSKHALYYIRMC